MRCVIPIRLVTDPAWGPDHVPSNELVPQASPTTSEARGTSIYGDSSYDDYSSRITFESVK